jgi:hypothetical protein
MPGGPDLSLDPPADRSRRCFGLRDLGVGDPRPELIVPDRARVADRRPGRLGDGGDGRGDLRVHVHRDGEPGAGPADRAAERLLRVAGPSVLAARAARIADRR